MFKCQCVCVMGIAGIPLRALYFTSMLTQYQCRMVVIRYTNRLEYEWAIFIMNYACQRIKPIFTHMLYYCKLGYTEVKTHREVYSSICHRNVRDSCHSAIHQTGFHTSRHKPDIPRHHYLVKSNKFYLLLMTEQCF